MKCPRCQKDNAFATESYESIEIDRCRSCKGVWLDEGELVKIVQTKDKKFSDALVQQAIETAFAGIPANEADSKELCPKCSRPMMALNYAYSSGFIIDKCPAAHGVWLDHNELEKVQMHHEHSDKEMTTNRAQWETLVANVEHKKTSQAGRLPSGEVRPIKYLIDKIIEIFGD